MLNGKLSVGFYPSRSHDIIDIDECLIQDEDGDKVERITKEWALKFNIKPVFVDGKFNKSGLLRHVMIRKGFKTGGVMVVLVVTKKNIPHIEEYINSILENIKGIESIVLNVNSKDTNVILGEECITLWGSDVIKDYIGDFKFNIFFNFIYKSIDR